MSADELRSYWCYRCERHVNLFSASSPPLIVCPRCNTGFLEQLLGNGSASGVVAFNVPIHQIRPIGVGSTTNSPRPASKASVESLPTIRITDSLLAEDPVCLCAVCKEQFVLDVEAKELPCKHIYHPDCILPWLSQQNSCPLCRFHLPIEDAPAKRMRPEPILSWDDRVRVFHPARYTLRRNRVRTLRSQRRVESSLSPTQMAETGVVERTDSVETISSRLVGGLSGGGGGVGEMSENGSVNEDADTVMSEIRVSSNSVPEN